MVQYLKIHCTVSESKAVKACLLTGLIRPRIAYFQENKVYQLKRSKSTPTTKSTSKA
jgi:hypothetical protein